MIFENFQKTIGDVQRRPAAFFKGRKNETGIRSAFEFAIGLWAFYLIFATGFFTVYEWITGVQIDGGTTIRLIGVFFAVVLGLAILFVEAAILYAWLWLFCKKVTYSKAYQLTVYASTPRVLYLYVIGWIPFVQLALFIWTATLLIIGIRETYSLSTGRAVALYLGGFLLLLVLFTLVPAIFLGQKWIVAVMYTVAQAVIGQPLI